MDPTPLGSDALAALLGDQARVRVRNATADDDGAAIVAVALARHGGDGSVHTDTEFGLELAAGETAFFEPRPPTSDAPALLELLLRVRVDGDGAASATGETTFIDLYLKALAAPAPDAPRGFDCGIRRHDGEIEADEQLVPGFADFAVFARAVR